MKLCNIGNRFDYEMEKLIRLYLPFEKIEVLHEEADDEHLAVCKVLQNSNKATDYFGDDCCYTMSRNNATVVVCRSTLCDIFGC